MATVTPHKRRRRVMAQMTMVMNLDKCIGCHTCSVTCKQAWTNRAGTEYVWFNNVETRPGQGYPRAYEDQDRWRGGWVRTPSGKLKLRSGNRIQKLLGIFASPRQPGIDDYYEPWTYDYENLTRAPLGDDFPVARPKSLITGEDIDIKASSNWDDALGGSAATEANDPILVKLREQANKRIKLSFERNFMFFLPRICEHCLNPSCMASCPSGAIYKRSEDGIVLVDQDRCRGWRQCITGCPYKKIYFNHRTGKAEKCTLCYPRLEEGIPTVCAETCVGRLRYLGVVLYDPDQVGAAAAVESEQDLYPAQLDLQLDPTDPDVIQDARASGIPQDWLEAAVKSPVYALIKHFRVALPLHPEYRTMPMVWYIPPLSPVVELLSEQGHDGEAAGNLFGAIDALRIPVDYLAELFTAGNVDAVTATLQRLAAMRSYMRDVTLGNERQPDIARAVGMEPAAVEQMYRLLAIAKYDERYVIPKAHREGCDEPHGMGCSLDVDGGPGMQNAGFCGSNRRYPVPVSIESFAASQARRDGGEHAT